MRHPPARPRESGDTPRIGVDDEGRVGEPPPRRHVEPAPVETGVRACPRVVESGVRHPQRIRAADLELPIHPVIRALALHYRVRGLRPPAPHRPLQPHPAHPPRHPPMGLGGRRAARHRDPFTAKLAPDLAHPVHPEVLGVHPADLPAQPPVATHPRRGALRLPLARLVLVVRRWRARHLRAHRPDPVSTPMSVDERHHPLARRSCSACANGGGVVCRR